MQPSEEKWQDRNVKNFLAANMRPLIATEVPVEYTGFYVTSLRGEATITEAALNSTAEFWRLAADATKLIRQQIKEKDFLASYYRFCHDKNLKMPAISLRDLKSPKEFRSSDVVFTTSYGAWDFQVHPGDVLLFILM